MKIKNKKNKKIVIFGGLGYLGAYLLEKISRNNLKIVVIDDLNRIKNNFFFKKFINKSNNIEVYSYFYLFKNNEKLLKNCDYVIHLSLFYKKNSVNKKKLNSNETYILTEKIIKYCKKFKIILIYISSISIYESEIKNTMIGSIDDKFNLNSQYSRLKLKEEKLIISKLKNFYIFRLPSVLGKSMNTNFNVTINKFCKESLEFGKVNVWENTLNLNKPYLLINDFYKTILSATHKDKIKLGIYNLISINLKTNDILKILSIYKKIKINFTKLKKKYDLVFKKKGKNIIHFSRKKSELNNVIKLLLK